MRLSACCSVPMIEDGGPAYCAACGCATLQSASRPAPNLDLGQTTKGVVRRDSNGTFSLVVNGESYPLGPQKPQP